jgi:hypothetical protein
MWERMQPVVDGYLIVSSTKQARDAHDGGKGARHPEARARWRLPRR